MRTDHVYVTVRRHRPLRPVDVLNPIMMTYWVARFTVWLLWVGTVFTVLAMVVLVVAAWKLATLGVHWLAARIEDKPAPPLDYWPTDEPDWTEPTWTHQQVVDRLPSRIAGDFRERAESRHFTDGTVLQAWGVDEMAPRPRSDGR